MAEMNRNDRLAFARAAEEFFDSSGSTLHKVYAEAVRDAMRLSADEIAYDEANPILEEISKHLKDPLGYRKTIPREIANTVRPGTWKGPRSSDTVSLFNADPSRTSGVIVQIVPGPERGLVRYVIDNAGPEPLTSNELAIALRAAAYQVEQGVAAASETTQRENRAP